MLPKASSKSIFEQLSLKGKVALVTGGSRGIGLEICRGLAEAGARIAIVYRSSTTTAEAATEQLAKDYHVDARAYQADVGDSTAIRGVLERVVEDFGGLDIAVANAGIGAEVDAIDWTPAQFREQLSVNLEGAFFTAQAAAKVFRTQGCGNIIFTTSLSAIIVNRPEPQAVYNASKAGLVHLAKSLAIEWIGFCRVNCISPGYIATDMISDMPKDWTDHWLATSPSQRFGETYELKGAYVFCASEASSFMTGAQIIIDGGYSLV